MDDRRVSMGLNEDDVLYSPSYNLEKHRDIAILLDPESPNWMATDLRAAEVMGWVNGRLTLRDIIIRYARKYKTTLLEAWLHCLNLMQEAERSGFISTSPIFNVKTDYLGRERVLKLDRLEEVWLHITNACNLECTHCLVNSSPRDSQGISIKSWERIISEAAELGVSRFYITGGEPFYRKDLREIIELIVDADPEKIVFLTNGTLLKGRNLKILARAQSKVELQISLEGPDRRTNDAIRGSGSFDMAVDGIKKAVELGIYPTVATTLMRDNLDVLPETTRFAAGLDASYHHLFLLHRRGRSSTVNPPRAEDIINAIDRALDAARETGIKIDNYEVARHRVAEGKGVKRDLSGAAWNSLCIHWDGHVYPSASLAGIETLDMGSAVESSLKEIWSSSDVAHSVRKASVAFKEGCSYCELKYICGGGDIEYSYLFYNRLLAHDPYCTVHRELIKKAMVDIARERRSLFSKTSPGPRVLFSMMDAITSQRKTHTLNGIAVATNPSSCILFLDADATREAVREFYAKAAKEPVAELCCPSGYTQKDTSHIPEEVLKMTYGCGSPMEWADIKRGEVVVDLGSGGGIDCFVAAKLVGPTGRVIGVDMTQEMLETAEKNKKMVAENLGYDVVEFKKGYLEEIPLPDSCADVVVSNCVINLSPDKEKVFSEIWRILKDGGRAVISDTLSMEKVPLSMRLNPRLWGECVSGALTEEEFLAGMERAGFHGIAVLKKSFWREVEGKKFYSAVIRGYKRRRGRGCRYIGQMAVYTGPFKAVVDEEGHLFPRGKAVEVCTDTAAKLKKPPYASSFRVIEPEGEEKEYRCCDPGKGGPC